MKWPNGLTSSVCACLKLSSAVRTVGFGRRLLIVRCLLDVVVLDPDPPATLLRPNSDPPATHPHCF
eukprot:4444217-Pyramimonas_sp.AAC.1